MVKTQFLYYNFFENPKIGELFQLPMLNYFDTFKKL